MLCNPLCWMELQKRNLAEREGFEPPIPFRVCRFSRPVPSTTRPPLRFPTPIVSVCRTEKIAVGTLVSLHHCKSILALSGFFVANRYTSFRGRVKSAVHGFGLEASRP